VNQNFFHAVFVAAFFAFLLIRAFYFEKARREQGRVEFKEGNRHKALRAVFGIPFMLAFAVYIFYPPVLAWADVDLPEWAQWLGVALGIASIPLILWTHRALGANFSTTLHVRDEHTLVTEGPYRWVRHPMYAVLFIHFGAIALLTQNWFVGGFFLAALTLIVVTRVQNEETAMTEKFGDTYREYIQRTGRFFPRGLTTK